MPRQSDTIATFNRGRVSTRAMGRVLDVNRVRLSAEEQTNYMPSVMGSMTLRPGTEYLGDTYLDNKPKFLPFIKRTDDTALLEFTDSTLRVWDDDEIVARASVSTAIRGGSFDTESTHWAKLSDPSTIPLSAARKITFSPDGKFMAVTVTSSPYIVLYSISGTIFTKLTDPVTLPAGVPEQVAFSPDGMFMAVAHATSPFVTIYSISGTTFTKLSNPGTLPAGAGAGVAFSPNSLFMAVAHTTSPFVTIYSIVGSTFTKIADPASLPAGNGKAAMFSASGDRLAIGHATSPYFTIYAISGSTFTKIGDPVTTPTGTVTGVAFSPAGDFFAAAHATSPYVSIYSLSGTSAPAKLADPATLPASTGADVVFSLDGQFLAVAHTTTPFVSIYDFATGAPVFVTSPGTLPDGNGSGCAFSADGTILGIAHATSQYVTLYSSYDWLDRDQTGTASTYGSGSSGIVAGPVAIGTQPTGWTNVTLRTIISASQISASGNRVSVRFAGDGAGLFVLAKAYIGHVAPGGEPYDTDFMTQLTFNSGSVGFSITNAQTIDSDYVSFALDKSRDLVISYYLPSPGSTEDDFGTALGLVGWSMWAITGDDAATANTSGYNDYTLSYGCTAGITQISVESSMASGYLNLLGSSYNLAKRTELVGVAPADRGTAHALRLDIVQGEVTLRVGTSYGAEDLIQETVLTAGLHSLVFTPDGSFVVIEVASNTLYTTIIDTISIEAAGNFSMISPYSEADLPFVRYDQSGDVVFLACKGKQQYKVERRDNNSWSIVKYLPADGPFRNANTSAITLTPSALTGDITITASRNFWRTSHVGALIRIASIGQQAIGTFTADNQFTSTYIKVTGVGDSRVLPVVITGTFVATLTLQRSLTAPGSWSDVKTYTGTGTDNYNDGLDNQVAYYRIGIKTGAYTSGTAVATMTYVSGSLNGIARVTAYTSQTVVSAIVLQAMGGIIASENWNEGTWSDYRGWPSSIAIEGRMWMAGKDQILGSVSDAFASFDDTVEGDSGPINRTIGSGPVDVINWLLALEHLLMGAQSATKTIRSSSFDEVVTPDNFNLKNADTQGTAALQALGVDDSAIYAQRSASKVFQLAYDSAATKYQPIDLTQLIPEICREGIVAMAIQRQPDTRLHCILGDGQAAVLIWDRLESVTCWIDVVTDGDIEDVVILPGLEGSPEDRVYYAVARTVGGTTKRFLERWAMEEECIGETLNKQADAYVEFTNSPASATVTGLSHLEGLSVVAWADGKCMMTAAGAIQTFTVASGQISLTNAGVPYVATTGIVGLTYRARFKSAKTAIAGATGSPFNRRQKINRFGLLMQTTHRYGVKFGGDFDHLDELPGTEAGETLSVDRIWDEYDFDMIPFNDKWSTNSRLCLESNAPRPAVIKAATIDLTVNG